MIDERSKPMLIVDMPSPFGKDGYPNCNTCELRFYCQKPELIDCPIKGEVVRCKDCCYWDRDTVQQNSNDFKWWNEAICKQHSLIGCNEPHEMWTDADWFCADGERKQDG